MSSINPQQAIEQLCQPLWSELPEHTKKKPSTFELNQDGIIGISRDFELYVCGKSDSCSDDTVRHYTFEHKRTGLFGVLKRLWLRLRRFHPATRDEKLALHEYVSKASEKVTSEKNVNSLIFLREVLEQCFHVKTSEVGRRQILGTGKPIESSIPLPPTVVTPQGAADVAQPETGKPIVLLPSVPVEVTPEEFSKIEKEISTIINDKKSIPYGLRKAIMDGYSVRDLVSFYRQATEKKLPIMNSLRPLFQEVLVAKARLSPQEIESVMVMLDTLPPDDTLKKRLHAISKMKDTSFDFAHVDVTKLDWRNNQFSDFTNLTSKGVEFNYEAISHGKQRFGSLGDYHVILDVLEQNKKEGPRRLEAHGKEYVLLKKFTSELNVVELFWLYELALKDKSKYYCRRDLPQEISERMKNGGQKQLLADYIKTNYALYSGYSKDPMSMEKTQVFFQLGSWIGDLVQFPQGVSPQPTSVPNPFDEITEDKAQSPVERTSSILETIPKPGKRLEHFSKSWGPKNRRPPTKFG